jgi:hypothetical protein
VRFHSSLREKAKSLACVRAFLDSEYLYFQRVAGLWREPTHEGRSGVVTDVA